MEFACRFKSIGRAGVCGTKFPLLLLPLVAGRGGGGVCIIFNFSNTRCVSSGTIPVVAKLFRIEAIV